MNLHSLLVLVSLLLMTGSCKRTPSSKVQSVIGEEGKTIVGNLIEGSLFLQDYNYEHTGTGNPTFQSGIGNYKFVIQKERRVENTGIKEKYYLVHHLSYLSQLNGTRILKFDHGSWHFDQISDSGFSFVYFSGMKVGILNEPRLNSANLYNETNELKRQVFANLNPIYLTNLHICQHLLDLDFNWLSHVTKTKIQLSDFTSCSADVLDDFLKINKIGKPDCPSCWSDSFPPLIKVGCSLTLGGTQSNGRPSEIPGNANAVCCGIMPVNNDFYYFLMDGKTATTYFYKRTAFPTSNPLLALRYLEFGNPKPFSIVAGTVPMLGRDVLNVFSVPAKPDFKMFFKLRLQINHMPFQYTYIPENMKSNKQKHLLGTIYRSNIDLEQKLNILFMCQGNYEYQCDLDFQQNKIILRFNDYRTQ